MTLRLLSGLSYRKDSSESQSYFLQPAVEIWRLSQPFGMAPQ
jgi:hypothetical protein